MEKEYIVGDLDAELEEIERINEKIREVKDNYVITYGGAFLSIMCCS